ncbi:MAG: hypothetical protein ABEJ28_03550 [Salinigranum sp.]
MCREFPVRTALFSFGLPLIALLQVGNAYVFDGPVFGVAVFAALVLTLSVQATRHQLAVFHRDTISEKWIRGD